MSRPRAAISVATRTRIPLDLKAASARSRAVWLLLPWIAIALMPCFSKYAASLFAPCFVRVNTSVCVQSPCEIRCARNAGFPLSVTT